MTRGERRAEKATRRVAKARRRSNIKSIWLLINARRKREVGKTTPPGKRPP